MKRWNFILILVCILALVAGAGYWGFRSSAAQANSNVEAPNTVAATICDVQQSVTAPGNLANLHQVNVEIPAEGSLQDILVQPGDQVQEGQMRQLGFHQPIIMLTARSDELDKVLGLEMGADDYVTKPFSLRELVSRIRAQLRRAYGDYAVTESALRVIGDLVLDQVTGQARRGEEIISLTPIEFRLLVCLAQHRGQVLTRAQIVEAVWGFAPDLESEKTVIVHIRRLREKIEIDPSHPRLILTVPGIGYKLVNEVSKL